MVELLRSNDLVLLSYVQALLTDARIGYADLDTHMSVLEGGIYALQRRIMVDEDDKAAAQQLLKDADLGHVLSP